MDTSHIDLLTILSKDTPLRQVASTNGGEYAGPCPFCGGGTDRFRVWPHPIDGTPRYWCRQCGKHGDAIQYLREYHDLSFDAACAWLGLTRSSKPLNYRKAIQPRLTPQFGIDRDNWDALKNAKWQEDAQLLVRRCTEVITTGNGRSGREYCYRRGLTDEIISGYQLGYNPNDRYETLGSRTVYLPRGVIIPWFGLHEEVWKVNIRRLDATGQKYHMIGGSANGLFGAPSIGYGKPVIMVEAEFCAMSVSLAMGEQVTAVATGSASGARLTRWIGVLALASSVILAFDADNAGDRAAEAWREVFPHAVRLRPTHKDVNEMLMAGDDIGKWIDEALSPDERFGNGRTEHA